MNTEALKQGSQDWLNARTGLITGSRVGAILGYSPFAKPQDVLREMVRQHHGAEREFTGNVATDWGSEHEKDAIAQYENEVGVIVMEKGFVLHSKYNIFGVSPDGLVGNNGMIESKCPYSQKIPDDIPDHYYAQVQLSLDTLQRDWCDFIYWTPEDFKVTRIQKDETWLPRHLPDLEHFYQWYLDEIDNPAHLEPLVKHMEGEDWEGAVRDYQDAKNALDAAKTLEAKARKSLIKIAGEVSAEGCGLKLTRIERAGAIDYSKVPQLENIDLEQYRKKGTVSYRIS